MFTNLYIMSSVPDPIKSVEDFDMNVCHPDEPLSLDIHYVSIISYKTTTINLVFK